jgi:hypothetical protein
VSSFGFSRSSELVSYKAGAVSGNSSLVATLLVLVFDDMAFDGLLMGSGEKASAVSAAPANTSKEAIVVFCNISALKISWISSCRTMRRRKIVDDAENADS